ncbi:MAG: VOC family protein, partial [Bradyrhizobium sp.]
MQPKIAARAPVDHVIFYTAMELPRWAAFFSALGFTVTPLGRHSTGSANHLVVLQDSYIELIGFEPGAPPDARPELRALSEGLSGIAFRGAPDPSWPAFCTDRFDPTTSLERPVAVEGVHGTARFRLTNLREPPTG